MSTDAQAEGGRVMTLLRRLLVLVALMFWLGGFTFYASVVVPIGADVLGSAAEQGWITRQVTLWLNVSGGVTLVLWAWDLAAEPSSPHALQRLRWLLWLVLLGTLLALLWLHGLLEQHLDPEARRIVGRAAFRSLHRWYLWINTVQWAAGLVLIGLTLHTWRLADRSATFGARSLVGAAGRT